MWESYNFENPYAIVNEGRWTYEHMNSLVKDTFDDLNGNTEKDISDRFGFTMCDQDDTFAFFYGFGLQATELDETAQMLDLIRSGVSFDLGMEYGQSMGLDIFIFRTHVAWAGASAFTSEFASRSQSFEIAMKDFFDTVKALNN